MLNVAAIAAIAALAAGIGGFLAGYERGESECKAERAQAQAAAEADTANAKAASARAKTELKRDDARRQKTTSDARAKIEERIHADPVAAGIACLDDDSLRAVNAARAGAAPAD